METLTAIFIRVIVPVMVTVAVGYFAARVLTFDLKMLARPCRPPNSAASPLSRC